MPQRRRRDPDAKRAALHAAAIAVLAEQPWQAVSVADIAARAGVAVGTYYRFYPTKMALIEALSDTLEGEFVAAMDAAWATPAPYPKRIDALAHALFALIAARAQAIAVMAITAGHRAPGSKPMGDIIRAGIARLYADGVAHGGFAAHSAHDFAAAAHGLVDGLMQRYFTDPGPARQQELAALLALMLRRLAGVEGK